MSFLANTLMGDSRLSKKIIQPLLTFAARFYVAFIFFQSGLQKVDNNFMITEKTFTSFSDDYKVPYLPPEIAAYLATYAELILPILLVFGLFSRVAALGLFIVNAVALYALHTTGWVQAMHNWIHVFYGTLLLMVFAYGPSKLSIDAWISDKLRERDSSLILKLIYIILLSAIGYLILNKYLP